MSVDAAPIADIVGFGMALHGAACMGSIIGIWKLHGESKFGRQPQDDMKDLRGKMLRSISQSLVDTFEPILTLDSSVDIPQIIMSSSDNERPRPRITTRGRETLLNSVRDFVQSDIAMMQSFRVLHRADMCVTNSLVWLRRVTFALAVTSGVFLVIAALAKFQLWTTPAAVIHMAGILVVVGLFCAAGIHVWRIMHAVNVFETLKDKHADLS